MKEEEKGREEGEGGKGGKEERKGEERKWREGRREEVNLVQGPARDKAGYTQNYGRMSKHWRIDSM